MATDLWAHQPRAVRSVLSALARRVAVLLVAPTGAGKTVMGGEICQALDGRTAWLTHTQDLVEQSARKLRERGLRVGVIAPGYPSDPFAKVQVLSVQTAVSREVAIRVENVFIDEAHHFVADTWRQVVARLTPTRTVGATATPERADGKALGRKEGGIFDELVVAASYSELIAAGHLVHARVLRPSKELQKGIALKPHLALEKHGEGRRGFGYCRSVEEAEWLAKAMGEGVADVVEANTPKELRAGRLAKLAAGDLRLLWNVYALTEGVDIPAADLAIFARNFGHVSMMLQSAGRVLRASPGKTDALILDLPGITHRLGLPVEDREYSLSGEGIRRTAAGMALTVCMSCGMTHKSGERCPRCGAQPAAKPLRPQRIFNEELRAVYSGKTTPDWAKRAELDRLRRVARDKKLPAGWVRQEYEALFGEAPGLHTAADDQERREEFSRLLDRAGKLGHKPGWATHRYKATFGAFPPRQWSRG